ncbi:hypothetical protein [Methylorubrum thiocyanatum]|uniref:hypothetical protein n=1 Tax=Methylorubrum thiocyanatum TaxID=47958 RepID=UPI0036528AD2
MAPFHLSDLRFEIAKDMIKICQSDTGAESQRDACSILNEVDISVRNTMFDKKPHVNLRSNWTHNPVVEPLMEKYKTLAGYANMYFDGMNREYDNINSEQSDEFYLLALLVLTFSASASVGESVYQYKFAQMDAAKKAKDTKINFIASLGKEV